MAIVAELKALVDEAKLKDAAYALDVAEVAERAAGWLDEPEARAMAAWAKGSALHYLSRHQEALTAYKRAETLYKKLGRDLQTVSVQGPIVYALGITGDPAAAFTLAEQMRHRCQKLGRDGWRPLAGLEMNLGSIYRKQGRPDDALAAYKRGRALFVKLDKPLQVARIDINRANVLMQCDRTREATELYTAARDRLGRDPLTAESELIGYAELNLGVLAFQQGHYQAALGRLEAARLAFSNNRKLRAHVDLRRAFVYQRLNLPQQAIDVAVSAETVFNDLQSSETQASARYIQAISQLQLQNYGEGMRLLAQARTWFKQNKAAFWLIRIDMALARAALQSGHPALAIGIAERLVLDTTLEQWPAWAARAHILLARCALSQRAPAWKNIQQEVDADRKLAQAYHSPQIDIDISHLQARITAADGHTDEARTAFRHALTTIEKLSRHLRHDAFRLGFLDEKLPVYHDALRFFLAHGEQPADLLWVLNAAHSAPMPSAIMARPDSPLRLELRALRERWHWTQNKLESHLEADGQAADGLQKQLAALESEIDDVYNRLAGKIDTTTDGQAPQTDAEGLLAAVQTSLTSAEAVLHYFEIDGVFRVLVITKNAAHTLALGESAQVDTLFQASAHHLEDSALIAQQPQVASRYAQRLLQALGQLLFEPLQSLLAQKSCLFLIMPPQHHHLPMAALRSDNQWLIERYQLVYLSAPDALLQRHLTPLPAAGKRYAVVVGGSEGGQLQHNTAEAQQVHDLLAGVYETTLLQDAEAAVGRFFEVAVSAEIVHLATHAVFRPDNPAFSWVRLSDRRLTVAEMYQHPLQQQPLVVLSACETGRGGARGGGLAGMARAWLAAGASELVVTLWPVEDKVSAELMTHFYRQAQSKPTSTDLTHAQRRLATTLHPFYWAGYIFIQA